MDGLTDAGAGRATVDWYVANIPGGAGGGRSQVGDFESGGEVPRRD